eukprot:SM000083S22800  [mRNA]  locus=s83:586032:586261:+ [translate_table: standard]
MQMCSRLIWACQKLHICRSRDDESRPVCRANALHQKAGRALVGGKRASFLPSSIKASISDLLCFDPWLLSGLI